MVDKNEMNEKEEDQRKFFEENKEELIAWIKHLSSLNFQSIDDMAEFCREWVLASQKKPEDQMLAYKVSLMSSRFFPYFLTNYFVTKSFMNMMLTALAGDEGTATEDKPAVPNSGVPKVVLN